jgi:two-component system response regulator FlrC
VEKFKEFHVNRKWEVTGDRSLLPSILVIEDDCDVQEAIVEALSLIGVPVLTAENGKVGLEKAVNKHVCAILSDINMPLMSGLEFLELFRKNGYDTPVIMLSAFGDKSNTVRALRMGAIDFLDKPFNLEDLEDKMTQALELGIHIKELEIQINELETDMHLNDEQIKDIRLIKKKILLMRYESGRKTAS